MLAKVGDELDPVSCQYIHFITVGTLSDGFDHVEWLRQECSDNTRRSQQMRV